MEIKDNFELGIIGCGNMAKAILNGIFSSGFLKPHQVIAYDIDAVAATSIKSEFGINSAYSINELPAVSPRLLVSVKPKDVRAVIEGIRNTFVPGKNMIISIAAGVPTIFYEEMLDKKASVVRVMPNTPALVNRGIAVISKGANAKSEDIDFVISVFKILGEYIIVDEGLQNAATAISGSGPAYFFLFCKLLSEAASEMGLSTEDAGKLVLETITGSAEMLRKFNNDAGRLIKMVASPGGTTEAALEVFSKRELGRIIKEAADNSRKRAQEIQDRVMVQ